VKHFDDDRSEDVLRPSSLDKEAVGGAATPIAVRMFKRRNDEKAVREDCIGACRLPSDPPRDSSARILGKRLTEQNKTSDVTNRF
jgi:hypothetical protein